MAVRIAPVGHCATHLRQSLHRVGSMEAMLSLTVMASNGHALAHLPHPMQADLHWRMACGPGRVLEHPTHTLSPFFPKGRRRSTFWGQAAVHFPHPVHLVSSTMGSPVAGSRWMASNGQTATQSPHPRHPKGQLMAPRPAIRMEAQDRGPSHTPRCMREGMGELQ